MGLAPMGGITVRAEDRPSEMEEARTWGRMGVGALSALEY